MKPGSMFRWTMVFSIAIAAALPRARAEEIAEVTGVHWVKSTDSEKKAYLIGIANIAHIELAYQGGALTDDQRDPSAHGARAQGRTLDSVRLGLDAWYAANPARLDRPVIETIWYEMVVAWARKEPMRKRT